VAGKSQEKVRKPTKARRPAATGTTAAAVPELTTAVSATSTAETPTTVLPISASSLLTSTSEEEIISTTLSGQADNSNATTTLKSTTAAETTDEQSKQHSTEPAVVVATTLLLAEATEMTPMVVVDSLDTLSAPDVDTTATAAAAGQLQQRHQNPEPLRQQQQPQQAGGRPINRPQAGQHTTIGFAEVGGTTLSPAIREMVDEYTNGIHAPAPEKLSPSAIETIRKNFEQKKNIFEQFVSFGAEDKAFVPNSEVFTSDWSARADPLLSSAKSAPLSVGDKASARSDGSGVATTTLATAGVITTTPAVDAAAAATEEVGREGALSGGGKFSQERNAEGGFKPMIKPLFSPLS
jgi:hypothetical protein